MVKETQIIQECKEHLSVESNHPDGGKALVVSSFSVNEAAQNPVKKPTRQWAAWTREEEESFFTALQQVGKNFEKITSRVQSKNKDQVRHYYYRLVRRMNKLLGPGFGLDAKNSNDTNAAMLRWWSLLEKYSCKASKLHLKPRRFKVFIETLEQQLLEDRKKNARKRPGQGENCYLASANLATRSKSPGGDTRAVKYVLVDNQNIQKAGNGRGSSIRRISNMSANQCRGLSPKKVLRQRRKPGTLSAAAAKKWEMAAIAGMSLVADAAEHLERTAGDKEGAESHGALTSSSSQPSGCNHENNLELAKQSPCHPSNFACDVPSEVAKNTMKLKLQFFPIDDVTRRALEMDKHNPHLELTLSTRKKITSVLEHLHKKWGSSRAAGGELMLFPYTAQRENLLGCQRWTKDSFVTAADVYDAMGKPSIFRLRYGWIKTSELRHSSSPIPLDDTTAIKEPSDVQLAGACGSDKDKEFSTSHSLSAVQSMADIPEGATGYVGIGPKNNIFNPSGFEASILWQRSQAHGGPVAPKVETKGVEDISTRSAAGDWADSLTNISVGDLLADEAGGDYDEPYMAGTTTPCCLEETPFSCDSFDAAIAIHIMNQQQNRTGFQSATVASSSPRPSASIWDAEETCDAFSFQNRISTTSHHVQEPPIAALSPNGRGNMPSTSSPDGFHEDLPEEEEMADDTGEGEPMEEEEEDVPPSNNPCLPENSSKELNILTETYWPDSLGPLDLDKLCSSRYYNQDAILSDSLGGLSRLIASSLDAFQNCSFFTSEKKGGVSSLAVEAPSNDDTP